MYRSVTLDTFVCIGHINMRICICICIHVHINICYTKWIHTYRHKSHDEVRTTTYPEHLHSQERCCLHADALTGRWKHLIHMNACLIEVGLLCCFYSQNQSRDMILENNHVPGYPKETGPNLQVWMLKNKVIGAGKGVDTLREIVIREMAKDYHYRE